MERRRVEDGLVGAALMLLVLVLVGVVLAWVASDPVPAGGPAAPDWVAQDRSSGAPPGAPRDLVEGDVWLDGLELTAAALVTADARLRDVRAVGSDVRTGSAGLVAGVLDIDATVPFEMVAEQLGDGTTVAAAGSRAQVERTVDVLGRRFRVVATGTVEVVRGRLVIEPTSIEVVGLPFPGGLLAALVRQAVTVEHAFEGMPEGMELRDVTVQDDGFRARLEGRDVRLGPEGLQLVP